MGSSGVRKALGEVGRPPKGELGADMALVVGWVVMVTLLVFEEDDWWMRIS